MKRNYIVNIGILIVIAFLLGSCSAVLEVNVKTNMQEAGEVFGSGQFEKSTIITLEAKANKGYEFLHWEEFGKTISTDEKLLFSLVKRRNIEAVFGLKEYLINASNKNPHMGEVFGSDKYQFKETAVIRAVPKEGFRFLGWEGIESTNKDLSFVVDENLRLIAHFAKNDDFLIEKKSLISSVSNNKKLFAFEQGNVISIYSFADQKTLADFELLSTGERQLESKDFRNNAIEWALEDEVFVFDYNNKLYIQSLDGTRDIIDEGTIYNYKVDEDILIYTKYQKSGNEYNVEIIIINIKDYNVIAKWPIVIKDLNYLDTLLNNPKQKHFLLGRDNILEIIDYTLEKTREFSFEDEIRDINLIRDHLIAVSLDKSLILLDTATETMLLLDDINPSNYNTKLSYIPVNGGLLVNYIGQSKEYLSYLFTIESLEDIEVRRIFNLPKGEVDDILLRNDSSFILLINDQIVQVDGNKVSVKLIGKDIYKILSVVNDNIFYLSNQEPGYHWKLSVVEVE